MRWDLVRFDLRHGLPTALRALRTELGFPRTAHAILRFLWRSITTNPFRALPPAASSAEVFSRHQLKPLLLFDDVLRRDLKLPTDQTVRVLRSVTGATGAAFIRHTAPHPSAAEWHGLSDEQRRKFIEGLFDRFENIEAEIVLLEDDALGFDVSRCHFVDLTQRLGRTDLAPLICEADRQFYQDPLIPIRLSRDETLARRGQRCAFRLHFEDKR